MRGRVGGMLVAVLLVGFGLGESCCSKTRISTSFMGTVAMNGPRDPTSLTMKPRLGLVRQPPA